MLSFKTFFESTEGQWYYLISIRCDSSGRHGYGGEPEVPAGDPKQGSVEWEFDIDDPVVLGKFTRILTNSKVQVIENPEGGSYHERWIKIFAFVEISNDQLQKLDDENADTLNSWNGAVGRYSHSPMKGYKIVGTFPFKSIEDVAQNIVKLCGVKPPRTMPHIVAQPQINIPHTNMSSDDWWKDQVNRTIPVNNKRKDLDGD